MIKNADFEEFAKEHHIILCNEAYKLPLLYRFQLEELFEPTRYYLTDLGEKDVKKYEHKGLKFAYCPKLDLYIYLKGRYLWKN